MRMSEVIAISWEGLVANKIRSLLTMLGVIIGVAAVIVMTSISAGTEATISEQINSLGANLIFISRSGGRGGPGGGGGGGNAGLVYDDAEALVENINGIVGVVVEQNSTQLAKVNNITLEDVPILGTTPDFPSVREAPVGKGRFFNERELKRKTKIAVLGDSIAQELFGDADPIGQKVTVGKTKLTVIGALTKKGIVGDLDYDARIYTPITVVFQKFVPARLGRVFGDRVRIIYAQAENRDNIDNIILQINLLLTERHDVTLEQPDFTVRTQQDIIDTQEATTSAFRTLLAWVAGVSLLVGGIGIMNIMLVSVTERTREIGIRQSVGATPNDIRSQFLTEALLLSLVGGLLGIALGVGGAFLFGEFGGMRTVIIPSSIVLAFTSAAAIGIFFGFYPANQAAQLDPIEALRHE